MSTLADKYRNTNGTPGTTTAPRSMERQTPVSFPCGVFWNQKTNAGIMIISGPWGRGRLAIFPTKIEPGQVPNPNAPQWYSMLSEQVSQERRAAKDYGKEMTYYSFWEHKANDGTIYLQTTHAAATETRGGLLLQLWPIERPGPQGPHWQAVFVVTPPRPANGGATRPDAANAANGTPQAFPTSEPEPATVATGEEIPF